MGLPELHIGSLTSSICIIQGGMGVGISLSRLASAVAGAGGVGVIATVGIGMSEPDFRRNMSAANVRVLRQEIRKSRELTDGIIGVNVMVALTDYSDHVDCAVEEGVDILFLGAGLPLRFSEKMPPDRIKEVKTQFMPIVSSHRATRLIFSKWAKRFGCVPDGVVVEGPMAGGHVGFSREQIDDPAFALENLVPGVVKVIEPYAQQFGKNIPVIAAGGIFTGGDIDRYLEMGAQGVQMGTRFVATHECDADIRFKEAIVNSREDDMTIIASPVGLPGRAIRNQFLDDVSSGLRKPFRCPWHCLKTCRFKEAPYCIGDALISAKKGNLEEGFPFAGANAYRVSGIVSVKELIDSLVGEYQEARRARDVA